MSAKPRIDELPSRVHLVVMDRVILLPEITFPLVLTDPRFIELFGDVAAAGGYLGFVQPKEAGAGGERRYQGVGCLGHVLAVEHREDSLYVNFEGLIRFRVTQVPSGRGG